MLATLQAAVDGGIPWKDIGAGGAALLVTGILVYVLRHVNGMHKEFSGTVKDQNAAFAATVKEQNAAFAATVRDQQATFVAATTQLIEGGRDANERREDKLHDLIRELRTAKP